jgi:hypothetical protein
MTFRFCFVVIVISGSIAIVGCGSGSSNSTSKSADLEQADIAANLAKLPEVDKSLAEAQKTCPITGEPLGSMGVPPKLTLKGETVFICCLACKGEAETDPDKTLHAVTKKKDDGK